MNLNKEIENAKILNWVKEIKTIANELCEKKQFEKDLMMQILNGQIYEEAQQIFCNRKKIGYYDKMNMKAECNL